MLKSALIGAISAAIAVTLIALIKKAPNCPECDAVQPKTRKPKNMRQVLWGGWTCHGCGCEIDRKGNKVAAK